MPRSVSRVAIGGRSGDLVVVTLTAAPGRGPASPAPGAKPPVVVVTANVHGDECTGTGVALRLIPLLESELTYGVLHVYPSLNPEGLERRLRRVPEDDQDLNRLFPGDSAGSPAERLAWAAWSDIEARRPDVLIDLHADAPGALPYVLLDRAVAAKGQARIDLEQRTHELARATGLAVMHDYPDDRYTRFRLDRSLTGASLNRLRVPSLTVEAGPRLVLDADAVALGVRAVLGVLHQLGMVDPPPAAHAPALPEGQWRRDGGPRASTSGVLFARVRPGVLCKRGDVVAEVRSLAGSLLEEVVAEGPGFVLAPAERTHVVAGVAVCTWATPEAG